MRSIKFPNMFNTNSTNVWRSNEYLEATKQNSELLLQCQRGELFGDPYFGLLFKQYLFSQNSSILRDQLVDMIYTQLAIFIPQIKIERKNIHIIRDKQKGKVICRFSGINQIDFTNNTFNLVVFRNDETR